MEIVIQSIMDSIITILNYQPLDGIIKVNIATLLIVFIIYKLWNKHGKK